MEELLKQIKKAAESMLRDATAQEKKDKQGGRIACPQSIPRIGTDAQGIQENIHRQDERSRRTRTSGIIGRNRMRVM